MLLYFQSTEMKISEGLFSKDLNNCNSYMYCNDNPTIILIRCIIVKHAQDKK